MNVLNRRKQFYIFPVSKNSCYQTSTKVTEMAELPRLEFSSTRVTSTVAVLCERDPEEAGEKASENKCNFLKKIN